MFRKNSCSPVIMNYNLSIVLKSNYVIRILFFMLKRDMQWYKSAHLAVRVTVMWHLPQKSGFGSIQVICLVLGKEDSIGKCLTENTLLESCAAMNHEKMFESCIFLLFCYSDGTVAVVPIGISTLTFPKCCFFLPNCSWWTVSMWPMICEFNWQLFKVTTRRAWSNCRRGHVSWPLTRLSWLECSSRILPWGTR